MYIPTLFHTPFKLDTNSTRIEKKNCRHTARQGKSKKKNMKWYTQPI